MLDTFCEVQLAYLSWRHWMTSTEARVSTTQCRERDYLNGKKVKQKVIAFAPERNNSIGLSNRIDLQDKTPDARVTMDNNGGNTSYSCYNYIWESSISVINVGKKVHRVPVYWKSFNFHSQQCKISWKVSSRKLKITHIKL